MVANAQKLPMMPPMKAIRPRARMRIQRREGSFGCMVLESNGDFTLIYLNWFILSIF